MILAPFLIFGWGTGHPFGVAGAAMSSLVAIVVAIVWLLSYFFAEHSFLKFDVGTWRPRLDLWRKMLAIGLPAGFEFAMTGLYLAVVYAIARPFGAASQAGFGIGMRIVQSGFMPVVALGFAVAPVAGQNFGAKQAQRVRDTFKDAAYMAIAAMLAFTIICQTVPAMIVGVFSKDASVIAVGVDYLHIVSWTFVGSGVMFVASSMFQAMGNTVPSLITSGTRIAVASIPSVLLSRTAGFQLHWIWYMSLIAVAVALTMSMLLLAREYRRRLTFDAPEPAAVSTGAVAVQT